MSFFSDYLEVKVRANIVKNLEAQGATLPKEEIDTLVEVALTLLADDLLETYNKKN